MDWGTLLSGTGGVLVGVTATAGAWTQSRQRHRREAAAQRAGAVEAEAKKRRDGVDERTDILQQINEQLLGPLKEELKDVRIRLKAAEDNIDQLEDTNDRLVAFVYKLIGMARTHGYDKDISPADIPPGIHL